MVSFPDIENVRGVAEELLQQLERTLPRERFNLYPKTLFTIPDHTDSPAPPDVFILTKKTKRKLRVPQLPTPKTIAYNREIATCMPLIKNHGGLVYIELNGTGHSNEIITDYVAQHPDRVTLDYFILLDDLWPTEQELDFEKRTGLPIYGTRRELELHGARFLATDPFQYKGKTIRIEQMQLGTDGRGYMWKRRVQPQHPEQTLFSIHLETGPKGMTYYPHN